MEKFITNISYDMGGSKYLSLLTFCRNFHKMGTASLASFCCTICPRCSIEILFLQLHILEQCTVLLLGRLDKEVAGSPYIIFTIGLEEILSSSPIFRFNSRSVSSRSCLRKAIKQISLFAHCCPLPTS